MGYQKTIAKEEPGTHFKKTKFGANTQQMTVLLKKNIHPRLLPIPSKTLWVGVGGKTMLFWGISPNDCWVSQYFDFRGWENKNDWVFSKHTTFFFFDFAFFKFNPSHKFF
ncbi:MAG: hypothetical protein CM15mP32_1830 [Flavobacteriaceae bacterium]|nr:MAG: hypothetical protein CM15mP32_1830 [Flavobacteriaceae bacterium]